MMLVASKLNGLRRFSEGRFAPVNCGDRTRLTALYLETQATAMTDGRD